MTVGLADVLPLDVFEGLRCRGDVAFVVSFLVHVGTK